MEQSSALSANAYSAAARATLAAPEAERSASVTEVTELSVARQLSATVGVWS